MKPDVKVCFVWVCIGLLEPIKLRENPNLLGRISPEPFKLAYAYGSSIDS